MKRTTILLLAILVCTITKANEITPPPEGKAVVYFVRPTSVGFLINFSFFDGEQFIGKWAGANYMRYECEPGKHIFWARSENRAFVNAELEAGKIYFVEAIPQMGAIKARVKLMPIDPPNSEKKMKKIEKLIKKKEDKKFVPEYLEDETKKMNDEIRQAMERYKKLDAKEDRIEVLKKEMYYHSGKEQTVKEGSMK